ncbi:MAG TPA: hypothetical protein VMT20_30185 [Terriglobia bacterium]|nr:hypothetical protein [Terriglobia bacterium]
MTHDEMQNELLRMEADLIDAGHLANKTATTVAKLAETVGTFSVKVGTSSETVDRLGSRHEGLEQKMRTMTDTLNTLITYNIERDAAWNQKFEALTDTVNRLATRIDRYIAAQGNGANGGAR